MSSFVTSKRGTQPSREYKRKQTEKLRRTMWTVLAVLPGSFFGMLGIAHISVRWLIGNDPGRALAVGALWGTALGAIGAGVLVIQFAWEGRALTKVAAACTIAGAVLLLLVESLRYATGH